jgi:hypothetical protein
MNRYFPALILTATALATPPMQTDHRQHTTDNLVVALAVALDLDYGFVPPNADFSAAPSINFGDQAVWILSPGTVTWTLNNVLTEMSVEPGVVFGFETNGGGSVTCASGFFACCYCNGDPPVPVGRCRRLNLSDGDCQFGGHGSESCSITVSNCPQTDE